MARRAIAMILRLDVRADRFARAQNRTVPQRGTYKCALREMDDCGTWYHGGRTYEFLETRAACGKCCDVKKRGLAGFANPSRIEFFC